VVPDKQIYVPPTISAAAQVVLKALIEAKEYAMQFPAPDDLAGWEKLYDVAEARSKDKAEKTLAASHATVTEMQMGGVTVEDIRPHGWNDNGKVLVYVHGGGYCLFSARSTFADAVPMATATGLRIVSVNYTPAPRAHFEEIQQQIVSVFDALIEAGHAMRDIAIYGESAGGALTASTVLNLRDQGKGMPAAAVFWSPNTDLSSRDDTTVTLDPDDPILTYSTLLVTGSKAYAGDVALDDPRVSPLYADLSKGFSPALIVVGTKEMLLSSSVRFYQALEAAGQSVKLDVHEGMWHAFPQYGLPESKVAVEKSAKFINDHLHPVNVVIQEKGIVR
jgi:epsilon-lactone hydrolase